ncbi:MAG TPA: quinone-dependent dihydroorotate dehydrogenase [Rubricoccaceae bacterium]
MFRLRPSHFPRPPSTPVLSVVYRLVRPLLFRLDAEAAHGLGSAAARAGQRVPRAVRTLVGAPADAGLAQTLWGLPFRSPVGLAAGFDKNAQLVPFWEALGFGWVDVGSVSNEAAPGNPRPRAFRLPADGALVNRMGLNNEGAAAVAARLASRDRVPGFVVSVNVAKTHRADASALAGAAGIEDVRQAVARLLPVADVLTLNVSCPNTADGKTFEAPDALDALLAAVSHERDAASVHGRRVPLLVKLSPDAVDVPALVAVALGHGTDGFVATNTAGGRDGLQTAVGEIERIGRGGLSGRPLAARALAMTRVLYRETRGRVPVVGVGGIDSAEAAYGRIRAGASLVGLYTALVYEGPGVVRAITRGLAKHLERDGFGSIDEAVGVDA